MAKLTETLKKETAKSSEVSEKLAKYASEREPMISKMTEMEATLKRYATSNRSLESQLDHATRSLQDMKKDSRRQTFFVSSY